MNDTRTLTRRRWIAGAGTGAAAFLAGGPSAAAAEAGEVQRVPRRILGKTGKEIPILLLGGGAGFEPKFDPRIALALRYGINYFDIAASYGGGTGEGNLATTLERCGALESAWITSKTEEHDAAGVERSVEASLRNLRRKSINLYLLHGLKDPAVLDDKALSKTIERLKSAGKIEHFGFSCHDGTVAELLQKAATVPFVEAIMFRYNFRVYGQVKLNQAMDAARKANIGLIAMKTQAAEAGFDDAWKKFEATGKWSKHQAVLKAVWSDTRITAAVSHMDTFEKLKQNVAAAVDGGRLGSSEWDAIEKYARATRAEACDGCGERCREALGTTVDIGTTLRCVMYHDVYGDRPKALRVFRQLPAAARALESIDFTRDGRPCPHGMDIARHLRRAREVLT